MAKAVIEGEVRRMGNLISALVPMATEDLPTGTFVTRFALNVITSHQTFIMLW